MRIKWLRRAVRSLAAEADFIANDNPIAADRMVVRARAAVDHLLDHPAMGRRKGRAEAAFWRSAVPAEAARAAIALRASALQMPPF